MFVQNQPFSFDLFGAYALKFCVFVEEFCSFLIHTDQKTGKRAYVKQLGFLGLYKSFSDFIHNGAKRSEFIIRLKFGGTFPVD